jgi:hypothetical protein
MSCRVCRVWRFGFEGPPGVSSCWGCVDVPAERITKPDP